jgi:hypothetical protein
MTDVERIVVARDRVAEMALLDMTLAPVFARLDSEVRARQATVGLEDPVEIARARLAAMSQS